MPLFRVVERTNNNIKTGEICKFFPFSNYRWRSKKIENLFLRSHPTLFFLFILIPKQNPKLLQQCQKAWTEWMKFHWKWVHHIRTPERRASMEKKCFSWREKASRVIVCGCVWACELIRVYPVNSCTSWCCMAIFMQIFILISSQFFFIFSRLWAEMKMWELKHEDWEFNTKKSGTTFIWIYTKREFIMTFCHPKRYRLPGCALCYERAGGRKKFKLFLQSESRGEWMCSVNVSCLFEMKINFTKFKKRLFQVQEIYKGKKFHLWWRNEHKQKAVSLCRCSFSREGWKAWLR